MFQNNNNAAQSTINAQTVLSKDTTQPAVNFTRIEQIAVERQVWEDNAYRASNEQLYSILNQCYSYYMLLTNSTMSKQVEDDLQTHINLNNHIFLTTTHPMTKIVKVVFNQERRRTSTYSIVLRAALAENVPVGGIPEFIRSKGGVQEISISKGDAKKSEERVAAAKAAVVGTVLAEIGGDEISQKLEASKVSEQVVIVATQLPNGKLALNAITYSESAVKAALAAYAKDNKEALSKKAAEVAAGNQDASLMSVIKAAV